ncbi:MAG: hypothetical protein KGZ68_16975 [Dechloromonas sp.]|nr:hypothetical protein [Dechloromonas sp.]
MTETYSHLTDDELLRVVYARHSDALLIQDLARRLEESNDARDAAEEANKKLAAKLERISTYLMCEHRISI